MQKNGSADIRGGFLPGFFLKKMSISLVSLKKMSTFATVKADGV